MNTQTLKRLIPISLVSILLLACSVEKKPETDTSDKEPEVPEVTTEEIEIIPEDEVVTEEVIEATMPEPKPPLTNKQLFSGTLSAHNRVRAKHGLPPLKWSDKLAKYSQQWADHLGKGNSCKMYHRSGTPPYGENLYLSSPIIWRDGTKVIGRERNRVTINNVVKSWADEERWYNYKTNRCQPGRRCGHYTQIVWRETTEVGCAVKYCGDESQNWVCSYNPPGNFTGRRPY